MKRKIIRTISILIVSVILMIGIIVSITIHPELILRKNKINYKNYSVYSIQKIDSSIVKILETVDKRINYCDIFQPDINHRIFLYNGNNFFKFIHNNIFKAPVNTLMYNHGNTKIQNITTFQPVDIENDLLMFDGKQEFSLTQLFVHEIVHTFQNMKFGNPSYQTYWKREGYADYISKFDVEDKTKDFINKQISIIKHHDFSNLQDSVGNWISFDLLNENQIRNTNFVDKEGNWYAGLYFISHVMTKYAFEVKGLDFDTYMSPKIKQNDILHEMFDWSETYKKQ